MVRIFSVAIWALLALSAPAAAADIKVISAGAVRGLIAGMIADYAQQTGHKFDFKVGTTGQLRAIIASGEPADLIIASGTLMAELEASGKMRPGSRADLGRVGIGVAIREGAAAPDLSTPDAFKQALTAAKSIAHGDPTLPNQSGEKVQKILANAGVLDAVKPKLKIAGLADGHTLIANGEVEIGLFNLSEITEGKGVKSAGAVPAPLQIATSYEGGLMSDGSVPEAARAFVRFLASADARDQWVAAKLEPLGEL